MLAWSASRSALSTAAYDFHVTWLRRKWQWLIGPAVIGLLALAGWLIPTGDFLVMPGGAIDTAGMVSVPSASKSPSRGKLLLVTIYSSPANGDEWLFGHVAPNARLLPARTQLPPNTSYERFRHIEEAMMADSQTTAKVVALRALGYDVPEHGSGVVVQNVEPRSAAQQAGLQKGDLITAIDGTKVETDQQLITLVGGLMPGTPVTLNLKPNNSESERDLKVTLGARPNDPQKALLGISPQTYQPRFDFPVQINIDSQGIIGPSAGLVLTLAVVQALGGHDITRGHAIAATGTVDLQGNVGPIGDVQDKVLAAEGKAEYFLAPKQDYEAARVTAQRLHVVEVDTIQQALDFLRGLA
jgi:PDZ domain-containing protein